MSNAAIARNDVQNLTIEIGSERYKLTGWTGLQVVRGIDQAADAFSFDFPWDPTPENIRRFRAYETGAVRIKYGGETVVTGISEKYDFTASESGVSVNIQGRSLSGIAKDLSAAPGEYTLPFNALARVIQVPKSRRGSQPPVYIHAEPGPSALTVQVQPGDSVYGVLSKIAAGYGLYGQPQPDGSLFFTLFPPGPPVADLREGDAPVMSVQTSHDLTKRYYRYTAIVTEDGDTYSAEAIDKGVDPDKRDGLIVQPEQDAEAQFAANFARGKGIMDSYRCNVTVAGWTVGSQLWRPGMTVTITYPSAMIYEHSRPNVLMVKKVTMQLDESGGAMTELQLTFPAVFNGGQPSFPYPWSTSG